MVVLCKVCKYPEYPAQYCQQYWQLQGTSYYGGYYRIIVLHTSMLLWKQNKSREILLDTKGQYMKESNNLAGNDDAETVASDYPKMPCYSDTE